MRLRIDLGYDGTDFSGWATQPGRRTVQGELTAALATVLRTGEPPAVTCAGRTDAGVHARGQVAHVDVPDEVYASLAGRGDLEPADALARRLRGLLPRDITLRAVSPAPPGFDARFSATSRRYRYLICDDPAMLDPLRVRETVLHRGRLDAEAMSTAAGQLTGLRDFAAFCRRREGASTVRTLVEYSWERKGPGTLEATVVADAFCHSMVRALVGGVVPVGEGREPTTFPAEVLARGLRDPRVKVMPAHGLVLEEVTYPADADLATRAEAARAYRTLPG
ncbi:tRNA pseudouridine(38-40) synthase TruA [Nostocoides sp. F2B08]|uniref:tRNA pseudouridine(38-40) synthase TruA n=1 Tax=Nostocoides sp. F2B08 TaxID=2653936 RepID=UPI0012635183|nr:tRNA pseudouridine(38-40) synthase TruA [Tetrasphaera sp. F2B08]KAB7746311.1 tRNA pseudouridine(38-40) synthase TruA [Tetrasphaera sp. F2B08]